MKRVDDLAFHIRLKIIKVDIGKTRLQLFKIIFKTFRAVSFRFTLAQQVQVGAVDDLYFHLLIINLVICKSKVTNAKYFPNLNWNIYIKQFGQYLKLERSLSQNSIDAYVRDVEKLSQFIEL